MEIERQRGDAKMELVQISRELMPAGRPAFLDVVKYPKIADLVKEHGSSLMLKVLFLMVKDLCNSFNVVRNMNEDQMIESASMLLDECDNFRLEDYVMMFSLAKRGDLVKVLDHLDITYIAKMMDEYWLRRKQAGQIAQEAELNRLDSLGNTTTRLDRLDPNDTKLFQSADSLAGIIGDMKAKLIRDTNE